MKLRHNQLYKIELRDEIWLRFEVDQTLIARYYESMEPLDYQPGFEGSKLAISMKDVKNIIGEVEEE